jgi:signal recognition particle subunit SRP68
MHGIRHHDYNRYRHYCSKKIKSESGLLFKAERAYYYSIQLNQESEQDYRKKQHSNKRLKKAIAFAQQILDAVSPNEVVSFLEASGYHRFLKSHYLMQKQAFKEAFENFQETKYPLVHLDQFMKN